MEAISGLAVGFLTGVLSGFGVGGGTLLLLWLTMAQHMDQLRAGGLNLVYFICCAGPALWGHIKNGLVEGRAVFWCGVGGVPACIAASLLAGGLDASLLRRLFGAFILVIGVRELFCKKEEEPEQEQEKAGR